MYNLEDRIESILESAPKAFRDYTWRVPELTVIGCASVSERRSNIESVPDYPRIKPLEKRDGTFSVIGYGPSLRANLSYIRSDILAGHAVCTTSGAHDYLLSHGIVPDYHADMDPRERKAEFLKNAHPDIHYLMASVCHPAMWKNLEGRKVSIWHLSDGSEIESWIAEREPGSFVHPSAQCIGLNAIILGHTLGYRDFNIYGVDCSYADGSSHAGYHNGTCGDDRRVMVKCGNHAFQTRVEWIQYARNFVDHMVPRMEGCTFKVFGDGLMQQMLREGLKEAT